MAASARHETRALLRAHLSAASSYGHLTRHCPICHRLLRLAMDAAPPPSDGTAGTAGTDAADEALEEESPRSA
ncbi:DUF6274 family protein [Streptomyces collinus]|uniref:DUF6274 family protein n=1 Tax=Streptomyces collinus TaxID=42684 RepID=UPI002943064A|nr:DUF6274 family protein [Streptomyces collinus]